MQRLLVLIKHFPFLFRMWVNHIDPKAKQYCLLWWQFFLFINMVFPQFYNKRSGSTRKQHFKQITCFPSTKEGIYFNVKKGISICGLGWNKRNNGLTIRNWIIREIWFDTIYVFCGNCRHPLYLSRLNRMRLIIFSNIAVYIRYMYVMIELTFRMQTKYKDMSCLQDGTLSISWSLGVG